MTSPKTVTPDQPQAVPVAWKPLGEAPRDGQWFIASTDDEAEIRTVHFADRWDRLPIDGTGHAWSYLPTKYLSGVTLAARPDQPQAVPDMVLVPHVQAAWDENAEQIAHNLADQFGPDFVLANQAFAKAAVEEYLYAAEVAARPVLPVETPAEGVRERIARALNSVLGSEADDHPRHHPAQNSWEVPSEVWWTQWLEAADAVVAALASTAPAPLSGRDGSLREALEECPDCGGPLNADGECIRDEAEREADDLAEARAALAAVPPETAKMEGEK